MQKQCKNSAKPRRKRTRELTNIATTPVEAGQNLPFTETAVRGSACIQHRDGSGVVTLRGITNQCRARYLVDYSGNIAVPTGGTAGEISLAIAIAGEPLQSTRMRVTPAAVGEFFNVSAAAYIDVPKGCCANIAIENTSDQTVDVANSNLIITREA